MRVALLLAALLSMPAFAAELSGPQKEKLCQNLLNKFLAINDNLGQMSRLMVQVCEARPMLQRQDCLTTISGNIKVRSGWLQKIAQPDCSIGTGPSADRTQTRYRNQRARLQEDIAAFERQVAEYKKYLEDMKSVVTSTPTDSQPVSRISPGRSVSAYTAAEPGLEPPESPLRDGGARPQSEPPGPAAVDPKAESDRDVTDAPNVRREPASDSRLVTFLAGIFILSGPVVLYRFFIPSEFKKRLLQGIGIKRAATRPHLGAMPITVCGVCGQQNRPGARFCGDCGRGLIG